MADVLAKHWNLELNYYYDGGHRNYKVQLTAMTSNLGRGRIWYFLCPVTGKRCRKLYLASGYFVHRVTISHAMYTTQARNEDSLIKTFRLLLEAEDIHNAMEEKYFRKSYKGRLTKKHIRLILKLKKIQQKITRIDNATLS